MCKSLKVLLDWKARRGNGGKEHSLALVERIRKLVVSKARLPTSFTNGIHLDIMVLKARIHSTNLDIMIIAYRQN